MLNMNFSRRVTIDTAAADWVASPLPGVWRKPLAREEAERGHATSVVRYDPGARFRPHDHPLGEEILVLQGTFSDATGDFHAGTYFRNPPGFRHAPFSEPGCLLLVKLHQFQPDDTARVAVETHAADFQPAGDALRLDLHRHGPERVDMLHFPAGGAFDAGDPGGAELFLLAGELREGDTAHHALTWLRLPPGASCPLEAAPGTRLWRKRGHLGD